MPTSPHGVWQACFSTPTWEEVWPKHLQLEGTSMSCRSNASLHLSLGFNLGRVPAIQKPFIKKESNQQNMLRGIGKGNQFRKQVNVLPCAQACCHIMKNLADRVHLSMSTESTWLKNVIDHLKNLNDRKCIHIYVCTLLNEEKMTMVDVERHISSDPEEIHIMWLRWTLSFVRMNMLQYWDSGQNGCYCVNFCTYWPFFHSWLMPKCFFLRCVHSNWEAPTH